MKIFWKSDSSTLTAGLVALGLSAAPAMAEDPTKIAHVYGKTGPYEAFAKQSHLGLNMGLEFATNGTMEIDDRKIEIVEKDTQLKPDIGCAMLAEAYGDDEVDLATGPVSSGVALAMLPIAEEYEKILIVEPAVADSITGSNFNRYIFRTSRNSSQDAVANAVALGQDGAHVATLAEDYAFGRDGVTALKAALKDTGATFAFEEYAPQGTTDSTAHAQHVFDAMKDLDGRTFLFVIWASRGNPIGKINAMNPERYGVKIATGGHMLAAMKAYKALPGMEGATCYYYGIPQNPVNDGLVKEHTARHGTPPDFFTAGGMAAGIVAVEAIRRAGSTDTEELITTMEGMEFETPKGAMKFHAEDHQAMQSMYHFKIRAEDDVEWGIPELVRELTIEDMDVPILNQ